MLHNSLTHQLLVDYPELSVVKIQSISPHGFGDNIELIDRSILRSVSIYSVIKFDSNVGEGLYSIGFFPQELTGQRERNISKIKIKENSLIISNICNYVSNRYTRNVSYRFHIVAGLEALVATMFIQSHQIVEVFFFCGKRQQQFLLLIHINMLLLHQQRQQFWRINSLRVHGLWK